MVLLGNSLVRVWWKASYTGTKRARDRGHPSLMPRRKGKRTSPYTVVQYPGVGDACGKWTMLRFGTWRAVRLIVCRLRRECRWRRRRGRVPVPLVMATGVPSHGARQSRGDVPLALGAEPLAYSCDNEEHDKRNNTVHYRCAHFGERNG